MCCERNDCLSAEIIFLQKCVQRHRKICVPVRIAEENGVVALQVFNMSGKFRSCVIRLFIVGKFQKRIMASRILLHGFNTEQFSARLLLNKLRNVLIITQYFAVHYNPAGSGYGVHAVCFRNGKICDQNISIRNSGLFRFRAAFCRRRGLISICLAFGCR